VSKLISTAACDTACCYSSLIDSNICLSQCWPLCLLKKVIYIKKKVTLIRTVYQTRLFQEKQELYTLSLLMNNKKPEIFLLLIPGTKGKHLPKQKTQQIFLYSPKPVPPHPSCTEQEGHTELRLHPSRAQVGGWWLWPSRRSTISVLLGFPFSRCTCSSVVVSESSVAF